MARSIRVGLMFGDDLMLEARKLLIESQPDLSVVYQERDGAAAIESLGNAVVDVVLVDNRLKSLSGSETIRKFLRRYSDEVANLPAFVLTAPFSSGPLLMEAIRCGASDVVSEQDSSEDLLSALRNAGDLERNTDFGVLSKFFTEAGVVSGSNKRWLLRLTNLSEHENAVLEALRTAKTTVEVQAATKLTVTQTRWALGSLEQKLGVNTRSQLALALHEAGCLDPAE